MDLIFDVKEFTILLLGVIFVALIAGSVQSVTADHLEPGQGIYKDENDVNIASSIDSKYQIHLQVEIRNAQGQLISIAETGHGSYIPEGISDLLFYEKLGKKEIVTIDNIKYEKVQYTFSPTLEQRWIGMYPIFEQVPIEIKVEGLAEYEVFNVTKEHALWKIHYCADFSSIEHNGLQCIPIFQVLVPTMTLEPSDVVTHQWTILRELS